MLSYRGSLGRASCTTISKLAKEAKLEGIEEATTMIASSIRRMTLEDYLTYDDGTDARYELMDGVLVEMGAEATRNINIAIFLISVLLQFVPYYCIHRGTEIWVPGGSADTRYPDLLILTEEGARLLPKKQRSLITADMPAPALVVEVVSPGEPGEPNYERDYVQKRREYALRGIPEYWLIDPDRRIIRVLSLGKSGYGEQAFKDAERIVSPLFPMLQLTAAQLLQAGD